ncbi:MAG TPA: penicillin-binding protein activator [Rhodanobacteraceae bacterium]|nr:penicillin-binding protein activator [Rhodanobacteraceae bacterium]
MEKAREDSTMRGIRIPAARLSCAWLCAAALLTGCAGLSQRVSQPSPEAPAQALPPAQQAQLMAEHARAQEANGDAFGAAHTWAQLSPLVSPAARADNAQQIRRLLMSLDPQQLKTDYDTLAGNDPLKPHARAALQQLGVAVARPLPQLDHPVGTEIGAGNAITREGFQMPARIALLLPMKGPLATPAEAVREGFFTAYFGDTSDASRPQVHSYDSGGTPAQSQQAYNQAVADGANLVIGPLGRDSVAAMFARGALPVPMLALNHPDNNVQPPPGSAEFGLLPEAEGAQAAAHMSERGVHQAIVFMGNDDRARRSEAAFKAQFESLGGQVLSETTLSNDNVDYSDAIKAALTDAPPDAGILLLMRPQTARVLMPQLHLAQTTQPVFATSLIYAGADNATADRDLDGVEFCDAPWLFDAQPGLPDHGTIAAQLPDARGAAARLFAFGMDAWALAPYLDWLRTHPGTYVPGATGQLTEDAQGRVHRVPVWASFQDGVARPVAAGMDAAPLMPAPATSSAQ